VLTPMNASSGSPPPFFPTLDASVTACTTWPSAVTWAAAAPAAASAATPGSNPAVPPAPAPANSGQANNAHRVS